MFWHTVAVCQPRRAIAPCCTLRVPRAAALAVAAAVVGLSSVPPASGSATGSATSAVASVEHADLTTPPWDFKFPSAQAHCVAADPAAGARWVYVALPAGTAPKGGWPVLL